MGCAVGLQAVNGAGATAFTGAQRAGAVLSSSLCWQLQGSQWCSEAC